MTISPPVTTALDVHDESVRIAVRALGDMRNAAQSAPPDDPNSSELLYRVSHLPIVNTALRAYSQGKASSRVVKYGAEMMENSVLAVSRPVVDRLPVNVNQIDEFACRQLDRLGRYRRSSEGDRGDRDRSRSPSKTSRDVTMTSEESDPRRTAPNWPETNSPFVPPPPPPPDSRTPTPHPPGDPDTEHDQQLAQRSRWHSVLLEAGGLSAALSEESMRRLKYCLHWLQYATQHIDTQILILRDFTATLQPLPPAPQSPTHADPISLAHMRTLTDVRRDVVNTIRQVVDVVSKYAGGALPEPARARVRSFILKLPQRWASAAGVGAPVASGVASGAAATANNGGGAKRAGRHQHRKERSSGLDVSPGPSNPVSPLSSPRVARLSLAAINPHHATPPTAGAAMQAAQRILALATESLDMMRGVTGVVKDSLDRAEAWVGRFRVVGLRNQQDGQLDSETSADQHGAQNGDTTTSRFDSFSGREERDGAEDDAGSRSLSTSSTLSSVPSTPGPPSPGVGVVLGLGGLNLERSAVDAKLHAQLQARGAVKEVERKEVKDEEDCGEVVEMMVDT